MHEKDDIRDNRIKVVMAEAEACEKVAYALKSEQGRIVWGVIVGRLQRIEQEWRNLATKRLSPPFYEYSKEDLNSMKAYQAKMEEFESLLNDYKIDKLLDKAKGKRAEAQAYSQGMPAVPAGYN